MKKIFVTGGTGFIGSRFIKLALDKGFIVNRLIEMAINTKYQVIKKDCVYLIGNIYLSSTFKL